MVTLTFPAESTADIIVGWQEWISGAERDICGMVNLTVRGGPLRCTVILATPPGSGQARAGDLSAAIGMPPTSTRVRTLNRVDFVHYFEGGHAPRRPRAFLAGSDIIGEMTSAAADSIVAETSAWPQGAGSATAVIESLSGAVGDVEPDGSAFRGDAGGVHSVVHRGARRHRERLAGPRPRPRTAERGGRLPQLRRSRDSPGSVSRPESGPFQHHSADVRSGGVMRPGIA